MNIETNNAISNIKLKNNIGLFLREIRIEKSLTGEQLGKLINVSQQQVSRYERGISSLSFEKINEILIALDVNWNKFICRIFDID